MAVGVDVAAFVGVGSGTCVRLAVNVGAFSIGVRLTVGAGIVLGKYLPFGLLAQCVARGRSLYKQNRD